MIIKTIKNQEELLMTIEVEGTTIDVYEGEGIIVYADGGILLNTTGRP